MLRFFTLHCKKVSKNFVIFILNYLYSALYKKMFRNSVLDIGLMSQELIAVEGVTTSLILIEICYIM
jgi:hypothetical protein